MKTILAAMALATLIGSPALAQSYDPAVGSGNIVAPPNAQYAPSTIDRGAGAFARDTREPFAAGPARRRPIYNGEAMGVDPDPNIQYQLNRELPDSEW